MADSPGLLWRGIGDFAEDGGTARAGRCGNVRRALVKGLVGEDGEGQGFFGVGRNIQRGTGHRLKVGEKRGQLAHEERILCAAAGYRQLRNFGFA